MATTRKRFTPSQPVSDLADEICVQPIQIHTAKRRFTISWREARAFTGKVLPTVHIGASWLVANGCRPARRVIPCDVHGAKSLAFASTRSAHR